MRALKEYSDASNCKTYPKPMTDSKFTGLDYWENVEFKIWLGLIGESEIEVAANQALEIQLINAFKEQRNERCQRWNPAQLTPHIHMWFLQSEADKAWCAVAHDCEFWQLVTQDEFNKAFPSLELKYVSPMEPMVKSKQSKVKVKPAHDEWTMDLFGATA